MLFLVFEQSKTLTVRYRKVFCETIIFIPEIIVFINVYLSTIHYSNSHFLNFRFYWTFTLNSFSKTNFQSVTREAKDYHFLFFFIKMQIFLQLLTFIGHYQQVRAELTFLVLFLLKFVQISWIELEWSYFLTWCNTV